MIRKDDPFYPVCDRCGEEFERFDYDPYLEGFGDPFIDHLAGQNPNYVLCPACKDEVEGYVIP